MDERVNTSSLIQCIYVSEISSKNKIQMESPFPKSKESPKCSPNWGENSSFDFSLSSCVACVFVFSLLFLLLFLKILNSGILDKASVLCQVETQPPIFAHFASDLLSSRGKTEVTELKLDFSFYSIVPGVGLNPKIYCLVLVVCTETVAWFTYCQKWMAMF